MQLIQVVALLGIKSERWSTFAKEYCFPHEVRAVNLEGLAWLRVRSGEFHLHESLGSGSGT